ncbi:MAG: hypothetical protein LBT74_09415 [Acidobacteriota bacterium]|jgi:hypothetical protein|nr:hypothetical protein [Acidobacteriota bacterium]
MSMERMRRKSGVRRMAVRLLVCAWAATTAPAVSAQASQAGGGVGAAVEEGQRRRDDAMRRALDVDADTASEDEGGAGGRGASRRPAPREEARPLRDPFSPVGAFDDAEFRAGGMQRAQDIPKMRLRGHLKVRGGETIALLEIVGGGVHIVREGDTVGLYDLGLDSVIRIRKIDKLHLVVESGSLGKTIIVR